MNRLCPLLLLFLLSISFCSRQSLGSYAGSSSSIIDPSKVKRISWKPRSRTSSISTFLSPLHLLSEMVVKNLIFLLNFYELQSFCVRRVPHRLGVRPLDLPGKRHCFYQSLQSDSLKRFLGFSSSVLDYENLICACVWVCVCVVGRMVFCY